MRTVAIANVALVLLVLGCGTESMPLGGQEPRGLVGDGAGGSGGSANDEGHAGSGTSLSASGEGVGGGAS